ncbi:MAG TPA: uroporphyrinogen-III synthase [bacterium]|nr:uroporphyrinogen-III synthase [bacterium]
MSDALAGRRIVVTRPRDDGHLRRLLEAEGAAVLECPAIQIAPPSDYGPLDGALRNLAAYSWIVFTSRNGVAAVAGRLAALGMRPDALTGVRLAVIGPGTGEALRGHGLAAALAPEEFRAEALVEAFAGRDVRGVRVLLPRAAAARDVLPDGLRALGAAVDVVAAYRTEPGAPAPDVLQAVRAGAIDAVTFTSSSTVRHFLQLAGPDARRVLECTLIACIGPVTAETARDAGLRVGAVASTYTLAGLVEALRRALGERRGSVVPFRGR